MTLPHYSWEAQRDLEDILDFIAQDKPSAAASWVKKIKAKCELVAFMPEMGELQPYLGFGVRQTFVGRYVIIYRYENNRTEILRVATGDQENLGL